MPISDITNHNKKLKPSIPSSFIPIGVSILHVEFTNPATYVYPYIDPLTSTRYLVAIHTLPSGVESCEVSIKSDDDIKLILTYP